VSTSSSPSIKHAPGRGGHRATVTVERRGRR
jgi:hypothetical protein